MNQTVLSLTNYDSFGDSSNAGFTNKFIYIYMPDKFFRMLVCGSNGAGKTNLLANILLKPLIQYDKICLYAKFLEQPKHQYLLNRLEEVSRKIGYDVIECGNDEVIPLDELSNDNYQKLIVFDDFLCGKQDRFIDYFIHSQLAELCTGCQHFAWLAICRK